MLKECHVAILTQNPKLFEELAAILKGMGAQVAQFPYGERLTALDH